MKKYYFLKVFTLIAAVLLLTQCKLRTVSMDAMRPAEITFPSYVKNLLLLDRTKFDKNAINIVEGVLTGELPGEDKAALQEAMNSFRSTIMASPRFKVVTASDHLVGNSITSAFPDQLSWDKIESLCKQYNTEAVVSFEIFDTDFLITNGNRQVKKEETDEKGEKREIEVTEYYAQGVGNVTIGIRLYDPKAKSMVDEQIFKETKLWEATGKNIADAVAHLIMKAEATRIVSGIAGANYAYKIAPMPVRITREFYAKSKKSSELTQGGRMADVNNWSDAIEVWKRGVDAANKKDAGRMCYDIAVAYEVIGDLENAKKWASKSYIDYGNKKARAYAAILDNRMRDEDILDQQMK